MHLSSPVPFLRKNLMVILGTARQAAYDRLESWLRLHASKPWDMAQTKVSIGPNGNYFATFPAARAAWSSIPPSLERLIDLEQPSRTPTLVTLGVKKTWFAQWRDGNSSCNLDSEYQRLEELLRRHGKLGVDVSSQLQRISRVHKGHLTC